MIERKSRHRKNKVTYIHLLLTEREGYTGEYLSEVVAVRTERNEVRTKTTQGQYSSTARDRFRGTVRIAKS